MDFIHIKQNVYELVRKAKTPKPYVTMSSVLPLKHQANPQRLAEVNKQIIATCDETDATLIDNDAKFTFRNGAVDASAFQKDGLYR